MTNYSDLISSCHERILFLFTCAKMLAYERIFQKIEYVRYVSSSLDLAYYFLRRCQKSQSYNVTRWLFAQRARTRREILFVSVARSVSSAITLSAWSRVVRRPARPDADYFWRPLAWECFVDHPGRLSTTVVRDILTASERRRRSQLRRPASRPAKRTICCRNTAYLFEHRIDFRLILSFAQHHHPRRQAVNDPGDL